MTIPGTAGSTGTLNGQVNGQAPGGDVTPAPLSEDTKREVNDMVNAAVNGAVTNHLTRFKKQFTEEITATLGSQLGPIGEQLKAMMDRQVQSPDPGQGRKRSNEGELPPEVKDALLRNEARIKELETMNAKEREMREQEKGTRLRDEERTKLANSLRERGIPDAQIKAAVAVLHTEDKRIGRTDDGQIVFRTQRGTGSAGYLDEMDLDKGVDEWLKTDEGKGYVPARTAAGAGGQPARPGHTPRNAQEARALATDNLAKILLGGGS